MQLLCPVNGESMISDLAQIDEVPGSSEVGASSPEERLHPLRTAFITEFGALDISQWSGTNYFMAHAIENYLGPFDHIGAAVPAWDWVLKVKQALVQYSSGRKFVRRRDPSFLRAYARQISAKLHRGNYDLILSAGSMPVSYLETDLPVFFWTDASFGSMINFYESYSNLTAESIRQGDAAELSALDRCRCAIYSSHWAAEATINYYGVNPSKVEVIPFGPNLDSFAQGPERVDTQITKRMQDLVCRLIFVGVEWKRKGGDIAVETAKALNEMGVQAELTIIGARPESGLPSFVDYKGIISKTTAAGMKHMGELFARSHFMLLPSRAECCAVVLAEANAFGVPSISTKVGGIPTVVSNGENGALLPLEARGREYAEIIRQLFTDPMKYRTMAMNAYSLYRSELNWDTAGARLATLVRRHIVPPSGPEFERIC